MFVACAIVWCCVFALREQVQFAAYKQFCDDTTVEKQRAIKEANAKMEQLAAAIQKATALCQRWRARVERSIMFYRTRSRAVH